MKFERTISSAVEPAGNANVVGTKDDRNIGGTVGAEVGALRNVWKDAWKRRSSAKDD
jgi:hypothetical protein